MVMRVLIALLVTVSTVLVALAHTVQGGGQGGDQFLDGIGETALAAARRHRKPEREYRNIREVVP